MAVSTISAIGGVIQGNWGDEFIVAGVADGTAKAGHVVGLTAAGVVDGTETTNDTIIGIVLEHYGTDMDTAPASPKVLNIVVPQSGHLYGIIHADSNSTVYGWGLIASANAGVLDPATDITTEHILARIFRSTDGDTASIVIWAA